MIDDKLTLAAARVARAAPQFWDELLRALDGQTQLHINACISSPVDTVLVCQGRAQALGALLALLKDCKSNADKIEERAKKK